MERQPVYNIYDIYEFTFENHVNPRMTSTETQFSQSLDFFAVTLEGAWSNAKWLECNKKLNQDAAHYVHIGLYSPDNKEVQDTDHFFIPSAISPCLNLIMNAANNVTILAHFIPTLGTTITNSQKHDILVLGRILEQVVQFAACACQAAWEIGEISPNFVPYDIYQFLDMYHKIGVYDRAVIQRLGYEKRYEVLWHESLRDCAFIL